MAIGWPGGGRRRRAKYNINVNAIAPTYIDTPIVAQLIANKEVLDRLINRIPMGRLGKPHDVVGAVLFLVSPASDFITGQVLFVDGGVSATEL